MITQEQMKETLRKLVSVPSVSGTHEETLIIKRLYEVLSEIEYFKSNPEDLKVIEIENDPYKRTFLSALLRSKTPSKNTIIINGHTDVVNIGDFAHLKDIAFNYDEFTKRANELPLDEDALRDFKSGEWLFGRGTADMKYGLSLGIELLREFSQDDKLNGNIMFLAVPGEESNSEGMLAAVPYLAELQEKEGYKFKAAFITECCVPKWQGDDTKRISIGTVGKIMPIFFCVGKESHVCEPFAALNPNLMISEITRRIELNPEFSEYYKGESNPPPTCLKQKDLKELYTAQVPLYATAYFNLITLRTSSKELLKKLKIIAHEAFESILKAKENKYKSYVQISHCDALTIDFDPIVITFEQLYAEVINDLGNTFENHLNSCIEGWKSDEVSIQDIAINIIKETVDNHKNKNPMIVIGFAPPYYPDRLLSGENEDEINLMKVIDKTIEQAKTKFNTKIEKENFYRTICDLSYTGLKEPEVINEISNNIPGIGNSYKIPIEALKKLNIPGVVFGGFGKDFHKFTERLSIPYSFDVIPELYSFIIKELLY